MGDVTVWADIRVEDMERARAFYSHVLGAPVQEVPGMEGSVATVLVPCADSPDDASALAEALVKPDAEHGCTIYLAEACDMDEVLERVVEAGGSILEGKRFYGPVQGWVAWIGDTEGNRVGIQKPGKLGMAT